MKVYVVGSSALYYWRRNPHALLTAHNTVDNPLADCPASSSELAEAHLPSMGFGNQPIRLMVPSGNLRLSRSTYKYSVQQRPLPSCAFKQIAERICVASPELCLLESSVAYSKYQLMELAMELCGKYALIPDSPRGYTTRNHQFASVTSICDFLNRVPHLDGYKQLLQICKFLKDGSRSPMETREYLLACLPKRHGGYGLPTPKLNARIELNTDEQLLAQRKYLECDMLWEAGKVVVEYDGHDDHASREDRARDALKRNVLTTRGYQVFTITGKQIMNVGAFDAAIRDIAVSLGHRLRNFPENWKAQRTRLRRDLFASLTNCKSQVAYPTPEHMPK